MTDLVVLKGACKTFPNGVTAVNRITLSFRQGETTVVLGPSGAGKSTLLRLINGLESLSEGEVWVDGIPVLPNRLRDVRRRAGMVFQQFHLVPRLTVMANVLCGRLGYRGLWTSLTFTFPKTDFALAEKALVQVGLADRAWDLASKLSGGQQQRVAIARTLVQECPVILADEPVASLDPATGLEVMEALTRAAKDRGACLIINLHQVELARRYADRIVGVKAGRVVFDVAAQDLSDQLIEDLYAG